MSKDYSRRNVNAPWFTCDVCEKGGVERRATHALRVEVSGRYGRKGSRSLGYFCEEHGAEKLARLRAGKRGKT